PRRYAMRRLATLLVSALMFSLLAAAPAVAATEGCPPEAGTTVEEFPKPSQRSPRLPAADIVTTTVSAAEATTTSEGTRYEWTVTTTVEDYDPYFYRGRNAQPAPEV